MPEIAPFHPDRNSVTTIRTDGSRRFLYPADSNGPFLRARRWIGLVLITLYLALPWIPIGCYPAVFLDVAQRRFHLFGFVLAAQDLWLLFFLISGLGFGLFFVTALLGRIWCGWACPQTVFLDHVYRRWERWLEGDAVHRRQLAAAPWGVAKIARKVVKHTGYFLLSAAIAHLFLAYFVSVPSVWRMMQDAPGSNWGLFLFIAAATCGIYFNFAWFREQLCIVLCPYGRIQSVLTDDHTLVIGYDPARGEPRGRPEQSGVGDCVDCDRCVRVCPTGIDIRQGLQMECIGCAACIDACDDVMKRLHRPAGLIRYDSMAGLAGRPTRWVRPRTRIYAFLLLAGVSMAAWSLSGVRPASLTLTRMTGAPYFLDGETVRNQFLIRLVNKRTIPTVFTVSVRGLPKGAIVHGCEKAVVVGSLGEEVRLLVIEEPKLRFSRGFPATVEARIQPGGLVLGRTVQFLGPETLAP